MEFVFFLNTSKNRKSNEEEKT